MFQTPTLLRKTYFVNVQQSSETSTSQFATAHPLAHPLIPDVQLPKLPFKIAAKHVLDVAAAITTAYLINQVICEHATPSLIII